MMKQLLAFTALGALTLVFGALAFSDAHAQGFGLDDRGRGPLIAVDADCYAVAEQVAQQSGGTVAKAVPVTQDGQPMCRIVILVPGQDGEPPRRQEIFVPQ
jgi:hypothetical protein